jgi:hypothetical protein
MAASSGKNNIWVQAMMYLDLIVPRKLSWLSELMDLYHHYEWKQ